MSSSDWDEIKRLAADFQRAQLSTSFQKLSEGNCIEIVNKLVKLKLLDIYFTSNGKEYITPNYLSRQIKDELFIHGGRIGLNDLSVNLDVSIDIIEKEANSVAKNPSISFVLNQLVSEDYLDAISEEINEKLQIKGLITIAEVAQSYDLPGNFVQKAIHKRIGNIINGKQNDSEPDTIFTHAFVSRHEYQIRGLFAAITHPVPLGGIIAKYNFQERLFFSTLDKFISAGIISGSITGGREASQAVYAPSIYSKCQYEWVSNFLKQNGYLEYKALERIGLLEAHSYIKKNFKSESLTFVSGAAVSQFFIDQISANIDDALANGTYIDILPFLPSVFSGQVCTDLINIAIKERDACAKSRGCSTSSSVCRIFCESIVVSENLLTSLILKLEELMPSKAQDAISNGAFKQQLKTTKQDEAHSVKKKDDRRKKAAGGKAGGGTQGRETKTKSTKNKVKGRKAAYFSDDDDDDFHSQKGHNSNFVEFLSMEEMIAQLADHKDLEDCPEELLEEIVNEIHESVSQKFQEVLKETYFATISDTSDRRKNHQQLQEKVVALLTTVRLAEKSLKEFSDETKLQLSKYLLRSHCSEIVNEIVLYFADDFQIDLKDKTELSPEVRLKIIKQLDKELMQPLMAVHKTISDNSLEEFLETVDDAVAAADIIYKKKDHKRDKQILLNRRSGLIEQLNAADNHASCLHLACLVLFQASTGSIIHASGKFVPQILAYLQKYVSAQFYEILREYQNMVISSLTNKNQNSNSISKKLDEMTPKLKDFTSNFKRSGGRSNSISED